MPEPPIDLIDLGTQMILEVALPGVLETDIEVRVISTEVVVRAELHDERGTYLTHEIERGVYFRRVSLPDPVELAHLAYDEGLLRIRLRRIGEDRA